MAVSTNRQRGTARSCAALALIVLTALTACSPTPLPDNHAASAVVSVNSVVFKNAAGSAVKSLGFTLGFKKFASELIEIVGKPTERRLGSGKYSDYYSWKGLSVSRGFATPALGPADRARIYVSAAKVNGIRFSTTGGYRVGGAFPKKDAVPTCALMDTDLLFTVPHDDSSGAITLATSRGRTYKVGYFSAPTFAEGC